MSNASGKHKKRSRRPCHHKGGGQTPARAIRPLRCGEHGLNLGDVAAVPPFGQLTIVNVVSIVSGLLAIFGLFLAWIQLKEARKQIAKTKTAAQAAEVAANRAATELSAHQLLAVFPVLHGLELELGNAVREDDVRGAIRVLHLWRQSAIQVLALASRLGVTDDKLNKLISTSNVLAAVATAGLLQDPPPSAFDATDKVREAIANVCNRVGPLVASLSIDTGRRTPNDHT